MSSQFHVNVRMGNSACSVVVFLIEITEFIGAPDKPEGS